MTSPAAQPLISVIILDSQDSRFLSQAIDSVRAQGIDGLELIIGDDIQQAAGQYLAFLEADGAFDPGALRARLEYLQTHPETSLVHGPVRLIDMDGSDLGAAIVRPKAVGFDAAVNPVHLSGVMGKSELFRGLSLSRDAALGWHRGWLLFAQVLSSGATSEYVEHGGAQHRVCRTSTLDAELQRHETALRDVLGWIYAFARTAATPGLRQPPIQVARRLREFSLFIWCLVSNNTGMCRSMMESAGLVAFLNTWMVSSIKDEIYLQAARHYLVNLKKLPDRLAQHAKEAIVHNAISLGLQDKAPSVLLAACECLDIPYPQDKAAAYTDALAMTVSRRDDARPFMLLTSFRAAGTAEEIRNYVAILLENGQNQLIDHVHVLLEGPLTTLEAQLQPLQVQALRSLLEHGKLTFFPIHARPHYQTLFDYANSLDEVTIAVINADILLPAQAVQALQAGRHADGYPVYALTRWNRTAAGDFLQGLQAHPPWPQWPPEARNYFEKHCLSYDSYVFDTPLSVSPELASVSIATYGCDTAIAAILRTAGYKVRNPCLSILTRHIDEKMRDYAGATGQKDLATNVEAFSRAILRHYAQHPAYADSLRQTSALDVKTAWLGGPGNADVMHTMFLNLGATPWTKLGNYPPFSAITLKITHGNLDSVAAELARIPGAIEQNIFIIWELYGFPHEGGHIADLLVNHSRFEAIGYPLFRYQWQAMAHRDIATGQAQRVLDDLRRMIAEILSQSSGLLSSESL
ncbi:hypothetical protein IHQ56_09380 [Methylobacillus flagellatus]|uniref:hypothetical protein n=1 Tax=Methylobacillus flagellatus TaxID=405 RepID=UPI002853E40A|nr:hypothetical protein [Methylobacillus flagellatus]MDR5172028.1 hypothetical protein [Methylobacillus flagellatus]